ATSSSSIFNLRHNTCIYDFNFSMGGISFFPSLFFSPFTISKTHKLQASFPSFLTDELVLGAIFLSCKVLA
ncbi:hypothetical protein VIGAN_09215300, partial [Vigna angularis var. angularis]